MRKTSFFHWLFFAITALALSAAASAQVRISVGFGPPALPVYDQPVCPGDGYMWTPGYWAWDADADDYYWVPGTWVLPPEAGLFWTPPYWGWDDGAYVFYDGYWGPHIGFYGGIDYGFGYFGVGFVGGRWDGGHFFYNRAYANIGGVNIRNVYNETVNVRENHVSYNGGPGGVDARPGREEELAARDRHIGAVAAQTEHLQAARGNPEFRANNNHGRPPVAATGRPGEFRGNGAVAAREAGGAYNPNRNAQPRGGEARGAAPRGGEAPHDAKELPPLERQTAPHTGNAKQDQKYQKQQDKLYAQQQKERQNLQQQQEREHQQAEQSHASQEQHQQMEQRHQQQTQVMQQRHATQTQQMQARQAPRGR